METPEAAQEQAQEKVPQDAPEPSSERAVSTAEEREAAEDAALEAIMAQHGLPDDDAEFQAEMAELTGAPAPATDQPEATPEQPEAAGSPQPQVDEVATHALRREGYSDEDIAALPVDLAQRLGAAAKERQDARQAEYDKLKASTEKDSPEGQEAAAGEPDRDPSTLEAIRPLAEELGLDDDGAAKLQAFSKELLSAAEKAIPDMSGAAQLAQSNMLELQRMRLEMRYPQVAEEADWQKVLDSAKGLDIAKYSGNPRGFFDAAVRLSGLEPSDPAALARHQQLAAQRDLGTPSTDDLRRPPRELSRDEQDDVALMEIFKKHGLE